MESNHCIIISKARNNSFGNNIITGNVLQCNAAGNAEGKVKKNISVLFETGVNSRAGVPHIRLHHHFPSVGIRINVGHVLNKSDLGCKDVTLSRKSSINKSVSHLLSSYHIARFPLLSYRNRTSFSYGYFTRLRRAIRDLSENKHIQVSSVCYTPILALILLVWCKFEISCKLVSH